MEFDCVTTDSGGCDCYVILRKLITSSSCEVNATSTCETWKMLIDSTEKLPPRARAKQIDIVISFTPAAEGQRGGVIEVLATIGSIVLMVLTFPISVFICFKGM
jgi:hypothetical protein